ncbi:hypothetical protein MASR2M32_16150 [Sphaerotilus sulfidivorans]|nr:hypothetical protein QMTAC487_20650 [Sphaerotilus sp. FB-3]
MATKARWLACDSRDSLHRPVSAQAETAVMPIAAIAIWRVRTDMLFRKVIGRLSVARVLSDIGDRFCPDGAVSIQAMS